MAEAKPPTQDEIIELLTSSSYQPLLASEEHDKPRAHVLLNLANEGLAQKVEVSIATDKQVSVWVPTQKLREMQSTKHQASSGYAQAASSPTQSVPPLKRKFVSPVPKGLALGASQSKEKDHKALAEVLEKKKAQLKDLQKKKSSVEKNCTQEALQRLETLTEKWLFAVRKSLLLLKREYMQSKDPPMLASLSLGQIIHMMKLDPKQLEYNYAKDDFSGFIAIPDGALAVPRVGPNAQGCWNWEHEAEEQKKKQRAEEDDGLGE